MSKILRYLPIVCSSCLIAVGEVMAFPPGLMAALGLIMAVGLLPLVLLLARRDQASMIEWGMTAYVAVAGLSFLLWPGGAGRAVAAAPVAVLYGVLFMAVVLPPLFGGPLFTEYFAKKSTPEAVWQTDIFLTINRNMSRVWALLFAACCLSALLPLAFSPPRGPVPHIVFYAFIPLVLLLGVGLPFTLKYPGHYQRKLGIEPVTGVAATSAAADPPDPNQTFPPETPAASPKEAVMSQTGKIVAINGSPHGGVGNTSLMIEMFRPTLRQEGFDLEVITLNGKNIEYCTGCALCLEKGKCWIPDEHRGLVSKLMEADGIILGAPVYFMHVPAVMKNFFDRSLAWGHKTPDTHKPGLAVSVAAAFGEVEVADYLARLLHVYGAYSVGTLTSLATGPGGFLGKEAVEARAQDLARDLARAIKEKRRYPASSGELFFYLHMGWLVNNHKDGVMADDYRHWREKDYYQGFEKFVDQQWSPNMGSDETRKAWIKGMIEDYKNKGKIKPRPATSATPKSAPPAEMPQNCHALIQGMPTVFQAGQAEGVDAVIQFKVSGEESFDAYLRIADGKCQYHEGQAEAPALTIETPCDVWLDIAFGRKDGQAAFMQGLYKVQGDISLLMRLNTMFSLR
ncbi:MAG: NAD(P)H-dependent oxidoreductase [Desulfarculaceae bacterium]|nr:NAD(P)H-dependent oxidoreductase [Desulfarculaceae bacterium]MCF8072979.1 NAD(P)H-dependent oxidoreductase [Desulfarculaceae bacterium]MCF8100725.1 NAD(P)H-dependent oxidoreductase [Desulfarculaceae bacterium]MCF8115463.1 NAD(P)H-dependent oxidoreductase [Desulfarculaceae bacterium]